jgi:putative nucleotidyltransferase with HDIG domain
MTLRQATAEQSALQKEPADAYVRKAQHLMPPPHILSQLLPLLNQPDRDVGNVIELISYDPSLTANVMRVCNSAYYNRGTSIQSLKQAITHIGLNETYRIVVAIAGSMLLSTAGQEHSRKKSHKLWSHSATAAIAAQILAQEAGEDENAVFTGGLLHDIGKVVFAAEVEDLYESRDDPREENGQSLLDVERGLFGVDHAELGGRLMEAWRLPTNLVAAVRFHHQPDEALTYGRAAACVLLGDCIAYLLDRGYGQERVVLRGRDEALDSLRISSEQLSDYKDQVLPRLEFLKELYHMQV